MWRQTLPLHNRHMNAFVYIARSTFHPMESSLRAQETRCLDDWVVSMHGQGNSGYGAEGDVES